MAAAEAVTVAVPVVAIGLRERPLRLTMNVPPTTSMDELVVCACACGWGMANERASSTRVCAFKFVRCDCPLCNAAMLECTCSRSVG